MRLGQGLLTDDHKHLTGLLTPEEQKTLRDDIAAAMKVLAKHFGLRPRKKGNMTTWTARRAYKVNVIGRVQGVFYRVWTSEQARELHVGGWVRNCLDGSVEAHLEGASDDLQALIDRLRQGPPGAHVDDVQFSEAEVEDQIEFEIRR